MYDIDMEQKRPLLITSEEISQLPILIIDKKGIVGIALAKILREQFLVVLVTSHDVPIHENVIHVPYRRKVPLIPDNAYSHVFVVYNGESEILDILPALEEKAEAVKARLFFMTSLLYSSQKLFAHLRHAKFKMLQTILYGETFDNTISEPNEINFFIHQARVYCRIEVPKEGLGKLYPIFFDDVLSAVISLAFAVERPKETIFLFPHYIYNQITIARIIQKIDPMIKVDFSRKKSQPRNYYIPSGGLYFYRNYDLEEKLRKIDYSRVGKRTKMPQRKIKLTIPDPEANRNRVKILVAIFSAIFIAPLIFAFIFALAGAGLIGLSLQQLEQGNMQIAKSSAIVAEFSFAAAEALGPSLIMPQLIAPQQKSHFIDTMQTGETLALSEESFLNAMQSMQQIYAGKSLDPKNDFFHALATIKNTLLTMQKLEAENQLPQAVLYKMHKLDDAINLVEETIDTWPSLLGFDRKKNYLILFQNNMELRPGGGFIGSYGILPIENGQQGRLQIHDVYDADGQLKQPVQPPYGLQRYLGVSHWFLRDSNFDPDFIHNAARAEEFLQKETGVRVDGVIAIDTSFLKNLISVVGPVYVPDYRETVSADNFYLLTENNSEKNFFPGSSQKKDFLRSLTNALMDKLTTEKHFPYEKLVQMIISSTEQKHMLFAFEDPDVQSIFTVTGLSSSLWDGRIPEQNTIYDYFGVVDANVGANKANYYIKRSIQQSTIFSTLGGLQTTADVMYTNNSTTTSPFGGDYKNYVQFVIPANANLESISINKKQQKIVPAVTDPSVFTSPDFIPPAGLEVQEGEEKGNEIIGFFFIVPEGTARDISVTYQMPSSISATAVSFSYNLKLFKQPGTGDDPYTLSVGYPNDFKVVSSSYGLTDVGGKVMYEGTMSQDGSFTATFSKK